MPKIIIVLDKLLEEKSLTRYWLSKQSCIRYDTVDNYYKNKINRFDGDTLAKFCKALDCQVGDIIQYVED